MQASLALTQFIPLSGIFPGNNQDPHADLGGIPLGSIRTFAGNFAPGDMVFNGSAQAEGQILQISQNTALFALLGNMYRGNGTSTFALPDLDGRTMIGAGQLGVASRPAIGSNETRLVNAQLPSSLGGSLQPFDDYQSSLPVTYLIRTAGVFPSVGGGTGGVDFIGQIVPFAGWFVPDGFLQANGQELQIAEYPELFNIIGTMYGGDGNTTFALPNLTGRTAVGASSPEPLGANFGQEVSVLFNPYLPVAAGGNGQPIDNHEPSASLTYLICVQGIFPSHDSGVDPTQQYLGEIVTFAGGFAPRGWVEAAGQLLPINQ
jgi:microcystin-dependent protein